MKQLLLDLVSGEISVEDVPVPVLQKGVIVANRCSLISAGTESALLRLAEKNPLGKAKERPDLTAKVISSVKKDGLLTAYQQVMARLNRPAPLGYSSAGVVVKTNVDEFRVGDRVACAGAGYANHAEYVSIPRNLCVKIPAPVGFEEACFTTVGAIALQGVRNAKVGVGDRVVVIGLGLIGLITVQILKSAGCKVFGIDISTDRIRLARELGADVAADYAGVREKMPAFSDFGADAVIITAATESNTPVELAGDLVRQAGRVVAVGDVGLRIPRQVYYDKEAEFVVSRSCGPGRYDRSYEERGIDYPIYVRWTEKRNMEAFLDLLAMKTINIASLVTHTYPIGSSPAAYELIRKRSEPFMGVVLTYDGPETGTGEPVVPLKAAEPDRRTETGVSVGCIGAGNHASSTLFPSLAKLPVRLTGLATATGLSAAAVAKKYGFAYCTTDYRSVLDDDTTGAVLIATRNDLHAQMTIEALKAGKHVFVEKPLARTIGELGEVVQAWKESPGKVQVGFNRRYSSLTRDLARFFDDRSSPMLIHYRVNAGHIPAEHWVHDEEQGGGMLISECCHFIDYLHFLTASKPVEVYARAINPVSGAKRFDNLQIMLSFDDGSLGSITYTTLGDPSFSKEQIEVFCDNAIGIIRDFRDLHLIRDGKAIRKKRWLTQDKGVAEELRTFLFDERDEFPEMALSTLAALKALESVDTGMPCRIAGEGVL